MLDEQEGWTNFSPVVSRPQMSYKSKILANFKMASFYVKNDANTTFFEFKIKTNLNFCTQALLVQLCSGVAC